MFVPVKFSSDSCAACAGVVVLVKDLDFGGSNFRILRSLFLICSSFSGVFFDYFSFS
jgi:hypothetical protein